MKQTPVPRNSAANPMIVYKADFDRIVSPEMDGPSTRERARKAVEEHGAIKILNRQEFIAYYYGDTFKFYPKLASVPNRSFR